VDTWTYELAGLLGGFFFLAKGAHWLVEGGAELARRWGVSPLLVGLTVIAWGTSMPEVVVSATAAWKGQPTASLGNVLGSNVANIGLVLGTCAWIFPAVLIGRIPLRETLSIFLSLGLLWWVCSDGSVTRVDAAILLSAFTLYSLVLYFAPRDAHTAEVEEAAALAEAARARSPWWEILLGSISIAAGAQLVMYGAGGIFLRAGVSPAVIGLTVFAIGTSLPELATGVSSALKKQADISVGNVVGSNVFNSLAVIGIAAMVRPFDAQVPQVQADMSVALERDFPVNLAFALAVVILPGLASGGRGRTKGAVLVFAVVGYMGYLLIDGLR
jgi:cation:H+ antiporter